MIPRTMRPQTSPITLLPRMSLLGLLISAEMFALIARHALFRVTLSRLFDLLVDIPSPQTEQGAQLHTGSRTFFVRVFLLGLGLVRLGRLVVVCHWV